MKVCEVCCEEINGNDTETTCPACDEHARTLARRRQQRRERHETLTSLGLVRVRGNLGGTYYE